MKYCLDASSLLHLWNEAYPQKTFPSLYDKLETSICTTILLIPIMKEIEEEKELVEWLKSTKWISTELSEQHKREALTLGSRYEIRASSSKGIGETDAKLIAYAKIEKCIVVTQEAVQPAKQLPKEIFNYKVPLVCEKENVQCINFLKFLQKNNIVV